MSVLSSLICFFFAIQFEKGKISETFKIWFKVKTKKQKFVVIMF